MSSPLHAVLCNMNTGKKEGSKLDIQKLHIQVLQTAQFGQEVAFLHIL
jgi:hypothetical protein